MRQLHLLPIAALLAFSGTAAAADTAARAKQQSACARTMQDEGAGARERAEDADIDGSGACALDDGKVNKASRANGGTSGGGDPGGNDATPPGHSADIGTEAHRIGPGGRVVTVDLGSDTLRGAIDGVPYRAGTDLFGSDLDYSPIPAYWHALPGYTAVGGAAQDNGYLALRSVAEGGMSAAPVFTAGALTARSGGSLLGEESGTSPTSPVPEPATWAMLLAGAGTLFLRRRS